jgi:cell division protein FtsN
MTVLQPKKPSEGLSPNAIKNYTVQVGAFVSRENAEKQKQFYHGEGFSANIETKYIDGRLLHLVWIADFETIDEAQNFGKMLHQRFSTPFRIVRK